LTGLPLSTGVTGILPAANGGAGTISGILKANGSGTVSAAVSATDYAPATSGSAILKGNGAGGFSNAAAGTDYESPLTFSTGLTRSTNTITVNTSQNIATLSNLTSNGLVTTSGGAGTLGVTVPGTGVLTALAVNVGSAGAFVTFNGAGGTPLALAGQPEMPVVGGRPVALVSVKLDGVPPAPLNVTNAPALPTLTARAVNTPVPGTVTPNVPAPPEVVTRPLLVKLLSVAIFCEVLTVIVFVERVRPVLKVSGLS
jgi:hypothetical protein